MELLNQIAIGWIVIGILSAVIILIDVIRHPQAMKIMDAVWPINALWGGPLILWAYFTLGKHRKMKMSMPMKSMKMKMDASMKMPMDDHKYDKFWQGIVVDALHCGAGCSLSDLVGSWIFYYLLSFSILNQKLFGEWLFDYVLALIIGVLFQYAAIAPMMDGSVGCKLFQAFKIDFWSLTAWQVGMYGWSAIINFGLHLHFTPVMPAFWLMMAIGMACGFVTAYPMNWLLVKLGIKKGM
ncbi:hypothetical protein A3O11_00170 [Ligilactobacillus aviarius]|uniref:DUF4396 domain-containing protein n=1 Tax=Ligilactobacillus aviarius TaxID=1606 RepID=UPI0007DA2DB2|nr:DUF4396 domain-containing protein [Ligilactobacillus aviarius]OAQ03372.1 hypothetical protein A3O11_00170 [Ligilactobacillus aviarius]OAQ03847.1 hypothetical protein A3O10_05590 [Ligilactobacillus aviarius]OAS77782.1 hypothetical protein A3O18_01335 [Ligilactobacillus aviarius]PEG70623.1 DUF4396 domain-containing protein [Ligilactobacillus aviarius]PEG74334.1 DUF4396 domain-containing protein [Ligilactobacillus aviarius]